MAEPDLNPTDNLYNDLKRAVHRRCPPNLTDLECFRKRRVGWNAERLECWNKIKRQVTKQVLNDAHTYAKNNIAK